MWIGEDVLDDPVTAVGFGICETIKEAIALGIFDEMSKVALFLVAKRFAVGDEILKIAGVRLINAGIVNLVDDAVADGEPKAATGVVGSADAFFRAGGPARLDSGRAKGGRCCFSRSHIESSRAYWPIVITMHGEKLKMPADRNSVFQESAKIRIKQ